MIINYVQRGSHIFPRPRDGVLILSAIHSCGIVIAVIAKPRVYRDGVRHRNRCVLGLKDLIEKKEKNNPLFFLCFNFVRIKI